MTRWLWLKLHCQSFLIALFLSSSTVIYTLTVTGQTRYNISTLNYLGLSSLPLELSICRRLFISKFNFQLIAKRLILKYFWSRSIIEDCFALSKNILVIVMASLVQRSQIGLLKFFWLVYICAFSRFSPETKECIFRSTNTKTSNEVKLVTNWIIWTIEIFSSHLFDVGGLSK